MTLVSFDLPPQGKRTDTPLWHTSSPTVAVVEVDPGYTTLQREFGDVWGPLLRAKSAMDALTAIDQPTAIDRDEFQRLARPLLDTLQDDLRAVADAYGPDGRGAMVGRQARAAGAATARYADTGSWPTVELEPPAAGEPWLHCGSLRSWSVRLTNEPLGFLLGVPCETGAAAVAVVDDQLDALQEAASTVLEQDVELAPGWPAMYALDLVLAGGNAAVGHKNFAHFLPQDSPASTSRASVEFTVLFANIHMERLRRCSLRLVTALGGAEWDISPEAALRASTMWFRCHDLGHFWRPVGNTDYTFRSQSPPFDRGALEETHADVIGVTSLAYLLDDAGRTELGAAFAAELLRYLSRNSHEFTDSAAARIELGWLAERDALDWSSPSRWMSAALPHLADLARTVRRALDGSEDAMRELKVAMENDSNSDRLRDLYDHVPTDLDYSHG